MINTNTWKEFPLIELFDITGSTTTPKNDLDLSDSAPYPYVTTAATNNGIAGYSDKFTEQGKVITIDSAVLGTAFYQAENFTASDHVEKLIPKFEINDLLGQYLVSVLNASARFYQYAYNDKRSQTALKREVIKLPATSDGQPDWGYMVAYMKKIMEESEKSFENLKKADGAKHLINVSGWKKFHLYDGLFNIDMGTKLDKAKMSEKKPEINFVGRANANNGITTRVDLIDGLEPYKAGYMTLSLGGEYLGSCFVQPKPFYTSQNVVVLIPTFDMSDNIKRFIATLIFKESRSKYKAFIDELNRHIKTDFEIPLPVTATGEPDWQYMEDYMHNQFEKSELAITKLQSGI